MEQNVINILENQFDKLPESLQTFIVSNDFKESLKSIAIDYNLDDKKQTSLENETLMVLLGLEPLNDLEKNLEDNIGLTKEQVPEVIKNVAEKIITPIEDDLRIFLEKELEEENEKDTRTEETKEETPKVSSLEASAQAEPIKKETVGADTEEMKKMLRENSKTVNIKNLIANLE
ncbi:hypothetical protein ACFL6I_13985 [candidate division KSB1 bacterium]